METSAINSNCAWCGGLHPNTVCPKVKAIDFYPDGTMKRVEFKVAADYGPPIPLGGQHSISAMNSPGYERTVIASIPELQS